MLLNISVTCSGILSCTSAISTSQPIGVVGGAEFWVLVGISGVTAAVGVMGSSFEWGGMVAAGVWVVAPAGVWFCVGVWLGSVRVVCVMVCA